MASEKQLYKVKAKRSGYIAGQTFQAGDKLSILLSEKQIANRHLKPKEAAKQPSGERFPLWLELDQEAKEAKKAPAKKPEGGKKPEGDKKPEGNKGNKDPDANSLV